MNLADSPIPSPIHQEQEHGPFDIVGDIHGCFDELRQLLTKLGYQVGSGASGCEVTPPPGRRAIFLGDLVDRGPNAPGVLRLVMNMVRERTGFCVPGNHDHKFLRKLLGRNVQIKHGLAETLEQMERQPHRFHREVIAFLQSLPSHLILDGGHLVVAHAGLKESLQGQNSERALDFALFGETTGEMDQFGLPVRLKWAKHYHGRAMVVYGHTPVEDPDWIHNTVNIDTGCVFGGKLTALRYPEKEMVSVPSGRVYCVPGKPFLRCHPAPVPGV